MKKFRMLVKAIKDGDQKTLERLRKDWSAIRKYVERHDPGKLDLPDARRPALILWLSTPPTPEPVDWAALTDVPAFVLDERQKQLAVVDQLWESWSNGAIVKQLEHGLRTPNEFIYDEQWLQHAKDWFAAEGMTVHKEDRGDQQARLDVVSGYGSFVDQLLLEHRQPQSEARIAVLGFQRPPVLELPQGTHVPISAIGEAIQFRSGMQLASATRLAYAISLSLPAHREILPTVAVDMEATNCWLKSDWQLPTLSV